MSRTNNIYWISPETTVVDEIKCRIIMVYRQDNGHTDSYSDLFDLVQSLKSQNIAHIEIRASEEFKKFHLDEWEALMNKIDEILYDLGFDVCSTS